MVLVMVVKVMIVFNCRFVIVIIGIRVFLSVCWK